MSNGRFVLIELQERGATWRWAPGDHASSQLYPDAPHVLEAMRVKFPAQHPDRPDAFWLKANLDEGRYRQAWWDDTLVWRGSWSLVLLEMEPGATGFNGKLLVDQGASQSLKNVLNVSPLKEKEWLCYEWKGGKDRKEGKGDVGEVARGAAEQVWASARSQSSGHDRIGPLILRETWQNTLPLGKPEEVCAVVTLKRGKNPDPLAGLERRNDKRGTIGGFNWAWVEILPWHNQLGDVDPPWVERFLDALVEGKTLYVAHQEACSINGTTRSDIGIVNGVWRWPSNFVDAPRLRYTTAPARSKDEGPSPESAECWVVIRKDDVPDTALPDLQPALRTDRQLDWDAEGDVSLEDAFAVALERWRESEPMGASQLVLVIVGNAEREPDATADILKVFADNSCEKRNGAKLAFLLTAKNPPFMKKRFRRSLRDWAYLSLS